MSDILKEIESNVKNNDVVLFMKGTRDFPMCGFSSVVSQILSHYQIEFKDINVLESDLLRQGIKDFSQWPTIPQLYVKGEFVGGCDILREMYEAGELEEFFNKNNISFIAPGKAAS